LAHAVGWHHSGDRPVATARADVEKRWGMSQLLLIKPEEIPSTWRLLPVGKVLSESQYGTNEPAVENGNTRIVRMKTPITGHQTQIASTLNTARQEIDLLKEQAEAFRKQKRGLMQKLLTGRWRVKIKEK